MSALVRSTSAMNRLDEDVGARLRNFQKELSLERRRMVGELTKLKGKVEQGYTEVMNTLDAANNPEGKEKRKIYVQAELINTLATQIESAAKILEVALRGPDIIDED